MNNKATETVSISMPGWLIEELDRARNKVFRSRSDFVSEAVRRHILSLQDNPEFWNGFSQKEEESS